MNRRSLLGTVSAGLLLAGCAGNADPGAGTPTITGEEFCRTGGCTTPGSATVTFADDSVAISGCISGPNGCAEAALETVVYRASDDRLQVAVKTIDTSGPNEACTEAIVYRGYDLDVDLAGGVPSTVVVVHRGVGDEVEAARVER
jgi:hypothetical protein